MDERKIYRAAFLERMNLLTLATAGTAAAFFPGFWCLAVPVLEAAYLVALASSDGYRARIQDDIRREVEDEMLRLKKALLRRLSSQGREKYSHFSELLREIEALSKDGRSVGLEGSSVIFADEELTQLSHLAWIYLKTVSTAERLSHLIFHEELAGVGALTAAEASRDMAVRIENLSRARDDRDALEDLLEDLENKAMLMRSNQILMGSAEILWRDLDQLAGKLESRTGWLDAAEVACGIPWNESEDSIDSNDLEASPKMGSGTPGAMFPPPPLQASPFSDLVEKIKGDDQQKKGSRRWKQAGGRRQKETQSGREFDPGNEMHIAAENAASAVTENAASAAAKNDAAAEITPEPEPECR